MSRRTRIRLLLTSTLLAALACLLWFALPWLPCFKPVLTDESSPTVSILLDRHGLPLHQTPRSDSYFHLPISANDLPQTLIDATLAAEDKNFFSHHGIDFLANLRAIYDGIRTQHFYSGASTISQQTTKLTSYPQHNRTLTTKLLEALSTRRLEMSHSKRDILTIYFNHLDYSNNCLGPAQAALHYFNKPLHHLSLSESALLAAIPQSPAALNPRRHLKNATRRRNKILRLLAKNFHYPSTSIERALAEPIALAPRRNHQIFNPQLAQFYQQSTSTPPAKPPNISNASSISITTIDRSLQEQAQQILRSTIRTLSSKHVNNGAVIILHNPTRQILALVGTHDYHSPHSGQINAALTPRSPGSALKPFTYLLAFDTLDYTPATILSDIPTFYSDHLGPQEIKNYANTHLGPVTLYQALGNSLNTTAVRTLEALGGPAPLHQLLKQLGCQHLHPDPAHHGLTLTIGTGHVTLLEITNAFATLASHGKHLPPTLQLSPHPVHTTPQQLFTSQSTQLITHILSSNPARSHAFGQHSNLHLPFPCAVKTGTSSDFRDNFCAGYTPDFTVGVWVGNLDNTPMRGVSGVTGAGAIFHKLMLLLHEHPPPHLLPSPPKASSTSLVEIRIDPHTGKLLSPEHARAAIGIHTLCPKDLLPDTANPLDYDSDGNILLPPTYKQWLSEHPALPFQLQPDFNPQQKTPHILQPTRNARYLLDPDLPDQGGILTLRASSSDEHLQWRCDSLRIARDNGTAKLYLAPGTHAVTLLDADNRPIDTVELRVSNL